MNFKTCPALWIVSSMGKEWWKVFVRKWWCEEDTLGEMRLSGNVFGVVHFLDWTFFGHF